MKFDRYFKIVILNVLLISFWGCFPGREPTKPDFKAPDVRRPAVAYHIPPKDATGVDRNTKIIIWFDELMNTASVEGNFKIWPNVTVDSLQAIAINKNNSQILYASRERTGIFKSEDGGENWSWLTINSMKMKLKEIVLSSVNDNLLYAVSQDSGLYRSQDGGLNWQKIESLPANKLIDLEIDPTDESVLFVATEDEGIYKSTDAGQSWETKNNGIRVTRTPQSLAINPLNPQNLYVASKGDFILKTVDGGENWVRLRQGLFTNYFDIVAIHPQDTSRVYAISQGGGIYRSLDAGENWELIVEGLSNLDINAFVVDPLDTNRALICTGDGLYQTNNGGNTWVKAEQLPENAAISMLAVDPQNPYHLFAATSVGVFKTQQFAQVWENKSYMPLEALYVSGEFQFEEWQDSTMVVAQVNASTVDTTIIFPYIYERALAAWYANGMQGEPPVDPNPKATKMIFTPAELLLPQMKYQARIIGTFEKDKETLRASYGAEDINGNSFETDYNFTFITGRE